MNVIIRPLCAITCLLIFILPTTLPAETLTIPGTGDGTAVLRAIAAAYSMQNRGTQIELPQSIGSGGGIKAAGKGETLLARVARDIKPKEQKYGLSYQPYAKVPAVFFTTRDIPVEYLSTQQICDIYSGKIKNWKQVGGPDTKIRVIRRENGDSTLSVLIKSFPGFDKLKITDHAETTFSTPETFSLMNKYENAIGFGPYDIAKNSEVRIIKVDGRDPTFSGYPSVTTLGFVYQEKNLTPAAQTFIEFATSSTANLPIIVSGGIPIN